MVAVTTEGLLTSKQAFSLTTATPLQRAICRVSDGLPLGALWDDPTVHAAFRGARPPEQAPETMVVLSAIRAAKSTMAAAAAIRMALTIDLSGVIPGDEIRIPILSVDKDSAGATFAKLSGMITSRPYLRHLLICDPTAESLWIRHPSGAPIEIKVVALAKYGSTVVSRWLGGVIFDEGPLMGGEDSVRNLTEARRAIEGRVRPGGQEWIIGSPWGAVGPVYDLVLEHQGRPTDLVVVARAPGPAMNPRHWTPERCNRLARKDPKAYRTNVLAEFADPEETLFPSTLVEPAMRREPPVLPREDGISYVAAIDPATRGNAWTLIILGHYGYGGPGGTQPMYRVALAKQWRGSTSRPLDPDAVLAEVAQDCGLYGADEAYTDQWAIDALRVLAERHNLSLLEVTADRTNKLESAETVRSALATGCLELPPDRAMRQDLVGVKKRITTNGHTLVLPKTGDGRHCDFVPPLCLCLANPPMPPEEPEPLVEYEPSFDVPEEDWASVTGVFMSR